MDNRQRRTLVAFENVLIFLDQHPIRPEPPLLAGMRKSLRASIDRMSKYGVTQNKTGIEKKQDVETRRRALRRERMMPLARIAKPLLRFAPGTERALTVPHARASAKEVADAALRMTDALKPHARLLKTAGVSPSFLTDMRNEARHLALSAKRAEGARRTGSQATEGLATEIRKAMQTVTVIEGLVMLHFAKEPGTVKLWRERRRVGARLGRPPRKRRSRPAPSAPALVS
jgi:hypothetical protein